LRPKDKGNSRKLRVPSVVYDFEKIAAYCTYVNYNRGGQKKPGFSRKRRPLIRSRLEVTYDSGGGASGGCRQVISGHLGAISALSAMNSFHSLGTFSS
jgi:hypothetical protein